MKFTDRVKGFLGNTTKSLYNSIGYVTRNYAKEPSFNPYKQVTGITYKAIDKIGQSLSVYDLKVTKKNGDTYVNHPVITLFNQPNPLQNGSFFTHLYAMLYQIYGETFWYLARGENTRKIKEVYLLNPAQVEVKINEGELVGYVLHKNNGQQIPFLPEEIIHDKRPNPFNEWRGMSVLEKAAVYIDTEINTAHFTLNYIKNNASPSGIVTLPDMDKETFRSFASQWREGYEGPENAGKTAFIRGSEAKFQAVGATLKDIDQEITRKMAKEDVLTMLDVPKPLLGQTDDNGFGRANVETLKLIFAENVLEPMMNRLDYIWGNIAKELTNGQPVDITHTSPIPEDKEFMLKTYEKGANVWLTVNEIRAEQNLEPLPNGDELMIKNTVANSQTTENKNLSVFKEKTVLKVVKKKSLSKSEIAKQENKKQEEFRKNLVETNDIYSLKVKKEISKFADKQQAEVIANLNKKYKAYEEILFNVKDDTIELTDALLPIFIDLLEAQAEDVANFITGELITITPEIRKEVATQVKQISGVYNTDTIKALEATLQQGITDGEGLAKLKKRVESVYSDAKGYRAERIARTESLRSSNRAAEQVYFENGYSKVSWFVNPGACEFCQTYAGKTKEIGKPFNIVGDVITSDKGNQMSLDYDDVDVPPLHPNCTCSIIPEE